MMKFTSIEVSTEFFEICIKPYSHLARPNCLILAVLPDLNLRSIGSDVCQSLLPLLTHGRVLRTRLHCLMRQNVFAAHISGDLFLARLTLSVPPSHSSAWNRQSALSNNSDLVRVAHIVP